MNKSNNENTNAEPFPRRRLAVALLVLAAAANTSLAAQKTDSPSGSEKRSSESRKRPTRGLAEFPLLFRSSTILRTPVVDANKENIGHIDELVIDARSGRVRYAALHFLRDDAADKLFAVPWSGLELERGSRGLDLMFDQNRKTLAKAPGFPSSRWPNVANRRWTETIDVYYGVIIKQGDLKSDFGTDVRKVAEVPHLMRSRKLIGLVVKDPRGRVVGTIDELIVDLNRAGVRYAAIRLKRAKVRKQLLPVPFQRLELRIPDEKRNTKATQPYFVLRLKHVLLGRAPLIEQGHWPDIRAPEWARKLDRYYGLNWKPGNKLKKTAEPDSDSR